MLVREIRNADTTPQFLVVADNAGALAGCQTASIPGNRENTGWIGTARSGLAGDGPASITLIGRFDTAPWQISEINVPARVARETPAVLPMPMPYAENLMANFVSRIFGREERAAWLSEDGALLCRAGTEPAGLVLESTRPWYGTPQMQLELQYSGTGSLVVAIAGPDAESLANPVHVGTIMPQDRIQTSSLLLPVNTGQWQSLVFLCPEEQSELALTTLRLTPQEGTAKASRSAWFWAPDAWQVNADELSRLAQVYRLDRLYITVPVDTGGKVSEPERLVQFIAGMSDAGVAVWAVAGDPGDVLPGSHAALQSRMRAFTDYNAAAGDGRKLSGVQLDIEPYLLPGFRVGDPVWQGRYQETIALAAAALDDQLPLSIVVPVWWGSNPLWGEALLDQLRADISGITVMNYRTTAGALRNGSLPFLYWSQLAGIPLELAVETGSVGPDQMRLNFARADKGRLLLLRVADTDLMVLMNEPVSSDTGVIYQEVARGVVSSANVSFQGDIANMESVLEKVVPEWSSWDSFSGIAIHGLEEHFLAP